jgi:hypothetical protein
MAGTAKPALAVAVGTPGAAAELQAALARRFGAGYQVVASASAVAALEALGPGTGPVALVLAGPGRGHLRRLRRAAHPAAGAPGRPGPGRHHLADPHLPRLPARDQRPGAGLAAIEQAIMFGAGLMAQPATGLTARAGGSQAACPAVVLATGGQLPAPACPRARRTDGRGGCSTVPRPPTRSSSTPAPWCRWRSWSSRLGAVRPLAADQGPGRQGHPLTAAHPDSAALPGRAPGLPPTRDCGNLTSGMPGRVQTLLLPAGMPRPHSRPRYDGETEAEWDPRSAVRT